MNTQHTVDHIMTQDEFDALDSVEKYVFFGAKDTMLKHAKMEVKMKADHYNMSIDRLKEDYEDSVARLDTIQKDYDSYMLMMNRHLDKM